MSRTHFVLTAVLLGALALPATAAPAGAPCFQISDAAGDSTFSGAPLAPASLDVLSADIATGPKNLVAVLRLKSLAREPYQATGIAYTFSFTLGGAKQVLSYAVTASGKAVSTYTPAPNQGTAAPVAVDPAAGTVTWTVPRKSVSGLKTRGASLTDLVVNTYASVYVNDGAGSFAFNSGSDIAETAKPYKDGTKTCLKGV